jgi:hypothetical protein
MTNSSELLGRYLDEKMIITAFGEGELETLGE